MFQEEKKKTETTVNGKRIEIYSSESIDSKRAKKIGMYAYTAVDGHEERQIAKYISEDFFDSKAKVSIKKKEKRVICVWVTMKKQEE